MLVRRLSRKAAFSLLVISIIFTFSLTLPDDHLSERKPYLVHLGLTPDFSGLGSHITKQEKGRYVFRVLRENARSSQAGLLASLRHRGIPHRSFFIVNAIRADLTPTERQWIARQPGVARVAQVATTRQVMPEPETGWKSRSTVSWGVDRIQAPAVWSMGYRGQGVVIGGQDTGIEWEHPALKNQYRGYRPEGTVDHNYNWHDAIDRDIDENGTNPCGFAVPAPCDDNDHGTHTMGIAVGDDGQGNQIGVAPEAQWIGCRNMESGNGRPDTYLECFEWFLAPTDLEDGNPNPDLAPDVINNSWACPDFEGCNPENWPLMEQAIENLKAAGIVVVVSAGNSGNACGEIKYAPAIFPASFVVGATDQDGQVASYSAFGPVVVTDSTVLKPDLVAPGSSIRSAVRGGDYRRFSGTSLSGPHVAGTVALILSARPGLRGQVAKIESILRAAARDQLLDTDCDDVQGPVTPNAGYGYGQLDALAAVELALGITSTGAPPIPRDPLLFPNPASGEVQLQLTPEWLPATVTLFDAQGRKVEQFTARQAVSGWSIASWSTGMYVFQVRHGEHQFSGKLIRR